MINGQCLCGAVKYIYYGSIEEIAMCHCSQCRKAQGGAYATNSPVRAEKLEFSGTENIKEYQSTKNKIRAFCKHCGSPLYSALTGLPNIKRLRLGTVQTSISCKKRYHIYTDSKADWSEITDDYPRFTEKKV